MYENERVADNMIRLNNYLGIPTGPNSTTRRMVDLSRQTGRTQALVDSICPILKRQEPVIVLVHNLRGGAEEIRRRVAEKIGHEYTKHIRFITLEQWERRDFTSIRGIQAEAYIDNAVFDLMAERLSSDFNALFGAMRTCDRLIPTSIVSLDEPSSTSKRKSKPSAKKPASRDRTSSTRRSRKT